MTNRFDFTPLFDKLAAHLAAKAPAPPSQEEGVGRFRSLHLHALGMFRYFSGTRDENGHLTRVAVSIASDSRQGTYSDGQRGNRTPDTRIFSL